VFGLETGFQFVFDWLNGENWIIIMLTLCDTKALAFNDKPSVIVMVQVLSGGI
jgi:hypothetical protein